MSTATLPTPGYMTDSAGRLVPVAKIKPIDLLRDQTVMALIKQGKALSAELGRFKSAAFSDIAAMLVTSAAQYDVKLGGEKGNVTLYSFDGRYKITRQVQETIKFDERLKAAKALIDECITEWSTGSDGNLMVLVNDAFAVDREGDVNTNRVLGLRRHNITDPKWQRAMQAISDSFSVVGSRSYVRLYERVGDTDAYVAIPLDLAAVPA